MGWLFSHRCKDDLIRELLISDITFTRDRMVLAHALVGGELWTVVQLRLNVAGIINGNAVGDHYTYINCDLIERRDGFWWHKSIPESISEEVGLYFYSCPLHFLDMAPDGINPQWRKMLRQYHQQRACN